MANYRKIIDTLDMDELDMPSAFKAAVRPVVEYLLTTNASFSVALRLSALMLESYKGELKVTKAFESKHIENKISLYSSPDMFFAFYLLMLASKVQNLYCAQRESICEGYELTCANDSETCALCREKYQSGRIKDCTLDTVPPFHVGCRCGMIFTK